MVEEIFFTDLPIKTALQSDEGCFEQGFDGIPGFEGSLKIPDAPGFEMRVKRELGHVNRQQGDDDQGDEQGNPPGCRGIRIQVTGFDRQGTVLTPVEFVTLMKALLQGFSRAFGQSGTSAGCSAGRTLKTGAVADHGELSAGSAGFSFVSLHPCFLNQFGLGP